MWFLYILNNNLSDRLHKHSTLSAVRLSLFISLSFLIYWNYPSKFGALYIIQPDCKIKSTETNQTNRSLSLFLRFFLNLFQMCQFSASLKISFPYDIIRRTWLDLTTWLRFTHTHTHLQSNIGKRKSPNNKQQLKRSVINRVLHSINLLKLVI